MAGKRVQTLGRLLAMLDRDLWEIVDEQNGWPSLIRLKTADAFVPVAVHVGPIGRSHRGRDSVERRFQNPGQRKPIVAPRGYLPLLLGVWEDGPQLVIVAMDATHRVGRDTRVSLFIPLALLEQASHEGWVQQPNTAGEMLYAMHPARLPAFVHFTSRNYRPQ